MKSMNFSQLNPFFDAFSASFPHDAGDAPPPLPAATPSLGGLFAQRKKFLDPNAISFSSLSKPGTSKPQTNPVNHLATRARAHS